MRATPSRRSSETATPASPACAPDVREQVVDDLAQPVAVADDGRLARASTLIVRDGLDRARGLDGVGDDLVEVDRLALERPALVEPREQQQVVDEQAHALRLARDPAHRALEVGGPVGGAAREELGVGAHRGERRPQLVRRVRDEAAQLPLGRLARLERRLDLAEHRVQRQPEPPDLGALVLALDALRQVAGGDRRRGGADRGQRPQPEPDDPEPEHRDAGEHGERHERLDQRAGGAACCRRSSSGCATTEQQSRCRPGVVEARTR